MSSLGKMAVNKLINFHLQQLILKQNMRNFDTVLPNEDYTD